MIVLAWSFFVVLSMVIASSQAFLAASVPGYSHSLTTYTTILSSAGTESSGSTSSERAVTPSVTTAAPSSSEEKDEDEKDEDRREDYSPTATGHSGRNRNDEQTVYVFEFETETDSGKGESHRNRAGKDMSDDGSDGQSPLDPWSIVWYIGSFGGLVAFFLIVSCSEWCCRRGARPLSVPYTQRGEVISANGQPATESPPPPYHLFAPPPYDSVNYAEIADKSSTGEKLDIYVITMPIHQPSHHQPPREPQPPA